APPTFLTSSVSSGPASFPDVFEDDISSSSSSSSSAVTPVSRYCKNENPSRLWVALTKSGVFVCLQTARPSSPSCPSALTPSLNFNHLPRPRKPRDTKPKMRKLKYHQYIPPDQRGAKQKSPAPSQPLDPAYSHLLKQQQVILQLQILQNQQQQKQQQQQRVQPQQQPSPQQQQQQVTTVSELRQQLRKRGLPVSGTKPALLQRLRPFQLPPACLAPAPLSPDPTLPTSSCTLRRTERFLMGSSASPTPSSWPRSPEPPAPASRCRRHRPCRQSCGGSLHPFLQQDPGCSRGKPEPPAEVLQVDKTSAFLQHVSSLPSPPVGLLLRLSAQVFCCQPCDVIGHDLELPVQITASPAQALPGVRSLEEELQEAIQKAQMDPRQSIDDILDEPMACVGDLSVSDVSSPLGSVSVCDQKSSSDLPPPPPADQNQNRDETFLPSPLCSSLLLELPPSPAVINPSQVLPAPPPPPPICSSPPPPSVGKSRKRRAPAPFDAADWLETLTSGLRPLTPPTAPFVEPDFSLDSDLNVNRVLDLMIEQW
uniref:Si:dkeyp-69b9.3 n=1 Tax=Acanthochromis polyacanthus TaxID=80966 RepID=A0A3Q1G405_9TELE